MSFTHTDVSFPVTGAVAMAGVGRLRPRLQPIVAAPLRLGTAAMKVGTGSWFSDAWWRFYVNDGDGMVVHGGPGGEATGRRSRVRIPPWTLAVLPGWMPWRIEMTAPTGHCFVEVDCPQVSSRQIAAHCRGAMIVPMARGSCAVGVARAVLAGSAMDAGAGNAVVAGIHQAMEHLVPALALDERPPGALAAVMAVIDGNLAEDLRVTALARRMGVSAKTLTTLFQRHVGVTPAVFVRERRLAQACHRLRSSDEDIAAIARAVGFAGREYLSRLMTSAVGMAPAAYRRGVG